MKSQFVHDCEKCRLWAATPMGDIYSCGETLILRTGNKGPDYSSIPLRLAEQLAEQGYNMSLAKAYKIAKLLGA